MINNDVLKLARTRLTKFRETLTEYETKWKNHEKGYGTQFEKDVTNTFDELIYSSKRLIWGRNVLYTTRNSNRGNKYAYEIFIPITSYSK